MPRVLLVDDEPSHLEAMQALVEHQGFATRTARTLAAAKAALEAEAFDLLITDLQLPDGTSLDLLPLVEQQPGMDLVLVTGHASVDTAVRAMRGGAADYLTKPIDIRRLEKVLANVQRAVRLRGQVGALREELRSLGRFSRMIGASSPMQAIYDQILKVAPTEATVLVAGETGTGKELVAETLHELSARADGPFVPLNCGAISPNLIESELFGHEKGSFTGATERRFGCFERADGGTLFLDEITEMSADLQVKLLRALESSTVQRVGGNEAIPVDVRVIAATNRDPHPAVADGTLREDLLYRLLVFPIQLPPLRNRDDDLDLLADHFLAQHNRRAGTHKELTRAARERLRHHTWPGNVRELKNVIERAFIMAETDVDAECITLAGDAVVPAAGDENLGIRVGMSNEEVERILTLATLDHFGEKKRTAEVLGISLKTLYNRLKAYKG
ncbi:MAG TPA: sigma-54 dependent transcriptional regulator [Myxococcota bacterium]|nr:sigma-54 dependent transcriptional regulator [Myxococcota bacterium]